MSKNTLTSIVFLVHLVCFLLLSYGATILGVELLDEMLLNLLNTSSLSMIKYPAYIIGILGLYSTLIWLTNNRPNNNR